MDNVVEFEPSQVPKPESFPVMSDVSSQEYLRRALLFWLVFSAGLLWLGPFTNYSVTGEWDPWIYTGYFTNFHDLVNRFGLAYYGGRLPYVLFGVLMYKVFSPLAANYLINVVILGVDTFCLYAILSRHTGRWIAATATFVLAFNPYLMTTIAWDYPDGPAIAFLLLGFWMVLAPPRRWEGNLAAAATGVFWAMAGYTNFIAGLVIIPGIVILLTTKRITLQEAVKRCAWLAVGVISVTIIFGLISLSIFHIFAFWKAQWVMYRHVTVHGWFDHKYIRATRVSWVPASYRLATTYGLTLIGGIFFIRYFRQLKRDRFFVAALLFLLFSDLIFAYVEFGMEAIVLRISYASSYMLVPAFIFFGALFSALCKTSGKQRSWLGMAAILVAVVMPIYGFGFLSRLSLPPGLNWISFLFLGIAGLIAASVSGKIRRHGAVLAVFCFILLISLSNSLDRSLNYVFLHDYRQEFKAALDTQDILKAGVLKERPLLTWYDKDERWGRLYVSFHCMYLCGPEDLTHQIPKMPVEALRAVVLPDTVVIHLTSVPAKIQERREILASRNIRVEDIGHWTVRRGNIEFEVYAQHVLNASELK